MRHPSVPEDAPAGAGSRGDSTPGLPGGSAGGERRPGARGRTGRRCPRCRDPIHWQAARPVGRQTFCSETCAVLTLADEASRTAWDRTALELGGRPRGLRRRAALALARGLARRAQRRLDRFLAAGPRAGVPSWPGLPPRAIPAAALLGLLTWGSTAGYAPGPPHPAPPRAGRDVQPSAPPALALPRAPTVASLPPPRALPRSPVRPGPPGLADDVTRGPRASRQVAFTFDGGDEANIAGEILDILHAQGVRVTMFLTGQFIRSYPDLVRRILAEGHEIGNHLDSHPHLTTYAQDHRQRTLPGVTRDYLAQQLRRAEASLRHLTGQPMAPFWRAPFGEHNPEIRSWAAQIGYQHVSWTRGAGTAEDLDTRDWVADRSSRIYRTRDEIAARILEFGRAQGAGLSGGIILMHLATHRRADRPHESLPHLLTALKTEGYRVVTISDLLLSAPSPAGVAAAPESGAERISLIR